MRMSIISAAIAASLISTAAFAATATDTIKSIDQARHQLTLSNGKVFALPAAWKPTGFKAGDKVTVTYQASGSEMMASAVTHAS